MCLSLIRRFGGSLWMSDKIREAQALAKRCKKCLASSSNPTTTTNYWYSEEFNHYDMLDSIHSLNLLVLWAQFLKDLGVFNTLYAGRLVMSSIASLTPCQSHSWWCCVLDATFLWQGLRWQWFHRLCYLVCILWVEKLVALSGCVICPFWHLQLRRAHIQHHVYMNNLRRSFWKRLFIACTHPLAVNCCHKPWRASKTWIEHGMCWKRKASTSLILWFWSLSPVPFAVQEEFALFYRKFFEAPGAAGFEACPLESACPGEMAWMKI